MKNKSIILLSEISYKLYELAKHNSDYKNEAINMMKRITTLMNEEKDKNGNE